MAHWLVIGLGNPGAQYEGTRHNAGFMTVDALATHHELPGFKMDKKSNALVSAGRIGDEKLILAKPQTFMNNSGETAQSLAQFYKIPPANNVVIHDDIDIPLGEIRVSKGSGSAGHKGVESIIQRLGTKDFARIRIGILPASPGSQASRGGPAEGKPEDVENFVLEKFTKEESKIMQRVIEKSSQALQAILQGGIERAMGEWN